MSTIWKVLLGLALALPLGAFVAGAVVASSADDPAPRETIVIQDAPSKSGDDDPGPHAGNANDDARPGQQPTGGPGDDDNDDDSDDGDEVEVVRPEPDTIDDDDNSGPGGGSDDDRDDGDDGDDRGDGDDDSDDTDGRDGDDD